MSTSAVPQRTLNTGSRGDLKGKTVLRQMLAPAGIQIDGERPFDIQVYDDRLYTKALPRGRLGLGEAYMDGWWDAAALDVVGFKVASSGYALLPLSSKLSLLGGYLSAAVWNQQSRRRSTQVQRHYDLGNDLFAAMLDRRMVYSCGYWRHARTLEEAQEAKLELICRKIGLRRGMRVLDIGCGWGGFAEYAAERYGASVTGITVSEEQVSLARQRCAGLPVEIRLEDYRDHDGSYDAIVSVGMFEHVGYKNYGAYMRKVRSCLKPEGLFLLHTIGGSHSDRFGDPWMKKYIFPNGMLPSAKQISEACEQIFVIEDWHNFGQDYDLTAMAWFRNFDANWSKLRTKYDERFYRMWKLYLQFNAGTFRARMNQVWQIVFSPAGVAGGYQSIRL